jgi:hypothetical protein
MGFFVDDLAASVRQLTAEGAVDMPVPELRHHP